MFRYLGADKYKSIGDAIQGICEKGMLSLQDRDLLWNMRLSDQKHLTAAWDTYNMLFDEGDLA